MKTIEVETFTDIPVYPEVPLIVVYQNPSDYPNNYVARLWNLNEPTPYAVIKKDIKEIRKIIPTQMVYLEPHTNDDPNIVATYV